MDIVYVCDNNYLPYLKSSVYSIQKYNENVNFIIISNHKLELKFKYNINFKNITFNSDSSQFKFKQNDRMREATYYKLFIPELLKDYDKVLFLDCDMLCQKSLDSLWNMNCEYMCVTESHIYGEKQAQELGLKKYASAGMLLMNLKKLREINFTNGSLDLLAELSEVPQHDETLINLFLKDKLTFIDKKYNYSHKRIYRNPIPERDAYILHFIGPSKEDMLAKNRPIKTIILIIKKILRRLKNLLLRRG